MSEIPYLAYQEKPDNFKIVDKRFYGVGRIVAPFTMVDVSNENMFKGMGDNWHAFASWLPLYDGYYWFFLLHGKIAYSQPAVIPQFNPLMLGEFEFYYLNMRAPLRYRQINKHNYQLPFTTDEVQRRTGKLAGVNLIDLQDTAAFTDIEKRFNKFIDSNQTDELIRLSYGEMLGVEGM